MARSMASVDLAYLNALEDEYKKYENLRKAAEEAHSLLGGLLAEAPGPAEKEIYRVFDLLRYELGIYAEMHPRTTKEGD